MTNGERIKAARVSAKMTQKELAKKLNVSYTLISQYERGERNPKIENLEKIADALDITVDELTGYMLFTKREILGYIENMTLNEDERYLIKKFRMTDERGKENILKIADYESEAHSVDFWDEYHFDKNNIVQRTLGFRPGFFPDKEGDINATQDEHNDK